MTLPRLNLTHHLHQVPAEPPTEAAALSSVGAAPPPRGRIENAATSPGLQKRTLLNPAVVKQRGNGDCLFTAISAQIESRPTAKALRMQVARFVRRNPDALLGDTPLRRWIHWEMGIDPHAYANIIAGKHWGGALEIMLLAHTLGRHFVVYQRTSRADADHLTCRHLYSFGVQDPTIPSILLLYGDASHYDAILPGAATTQLHLDIAVLVALASLS